jgi:hypothetical protein
MEGQARSALLVARSARNQQVSPSKIHLCLVYFYLFFCCGRRWRAAVDAVARGRRASALARRSARSEHMGTPTEVVSEIESPGFCARLP